MYQETTETARKDLLEEEKNIAYEAKMSFNI